MAVEVPLFPCWIFDLDGTLTVPMHDFSAKARELGIPPGTPMLEFAHTASPAERQRILEAVEAWEWSLAEAAVPAPGAVALVSSLNERGCHLGILTRNTRAIALRTLEVIGLGTFFPEAVVVGRDEARPKPDSEGVVKLLAALAASPHQALMVGDYLFDLQAGHGAGVSTLWTIPAHCVADYSGWADFVVPSLEEVILLPD